MTWKPKHPSQWAGALGGLLCVQFAAAQSIDELYSQGARRVAQAAAQQEEIDAIVEATEDIFSDYQEALREIENAQAYNRLLQAQVDGQNQRLDELQASIDNVSFIERQVLPLMDRMINGLEEFVAADVPFLLEERMERVARLRETLGRSDVSSATQFRSVMEAWQIEMTDYGQRSDVYVDTLELEGGTREVELLRVGRIALLYLTRDGSQAGFWDRETNAWVRLDNSMAPEIRTGIDAVKEGIPALFMVPVSAAELGEEG